ALNDDTIWKRATTANLQVFKVRLSVQNPACYELRARAPRRDLRRRGDRVKRRKFIALLSGVAAFPLAGTAQVGKVWTVGILVAGIPDPTAFLDAFRDGLRQAGYTEGQNIELDIRSAEGKAERLPGLAAELVRRNVDIIVGFQTPAVQAAK